MMKSKFTVALISGAALALAACSSKPAAQNRAEVAGPTTIRDAVRLTGTIEPLDSVELKSEVSGRIVKVFFKEGDSVKRGQLILILDSVPLLLTRDKFALQVDRGNLAHKIAVRELERAKEIFQTGTVTKDRLEDLETAVQRAELDVRDAKLSLRNAELDLARTRIRAPMDGRLINFPAEVGEVASSATGVNGGSALGTIADPTKLKVVVEVGELDFGRLRLGMPVKVSSEGGRPRPGKVSFIPSSARASNDTKTIKVFPVEVVLDGESEGILPGMTVGVDFVFLEREVAVSVPYEALKTGAKSAGKGVSGKTGSDSQKTAMTDSVKSDPRPAMAGAGGDSSGRKRDRKSRRDGGVSDVAGAGFATKSATVLVRGEKKGEFVPKQVKIGVTDYRRTEIVEGLAVGDTVWVQDESTTKGAASKAGGPGGMR
jgi:HlyD family secretion protein